MKKGWGCPHAGGDPDRLAAKLQLSRPPRLASGPHSGIPGSPAASAPPPEPARPRDPRVASQRRRGLCPQPQGLAGPGRAGVGPRGVAAGLSPPARAPRPGPRGCGGLGAPRVGRGSSAAASLRPGQRCWLRPGPRTGGTHPRQAARAMPTWCSPVPRAAARSPLPAADNDDLGSTDSFGVGGKEGVKLPRLAVQNGTNPC